MPRNPSGDEPPDEALLSDADRRGIAAIRAELEREFAAAQAPVTPPSPQRLTAIPPRRRRIGLIVAGWFVAGCLVGSAAAVAILESRGDFTVASSPETAPRSEPARPAATGVGTRAADVEEALREWLDATKRRDIPAQMAFYPPVVAVYYTRRDVPRAQVRVEKLKVFGDLDVALIRTGSPEIVTKPSGLVVTRFRKRYVLEGPRVNRRGEVVQELEWSRTVDGWKIVSERDVEVLSRR